ncbi:MULTISPECIES: hypothetical protein [unclassified Streptomyces]|uniref:hypothetical protein n=1 Tax=unclassified Streptomyces TaxID=2593676 RepID=UPI003700E028
MNEASEREAGGGVGQEGAAGVAVEREIVHTQHPGTTPVRRHHTGDLHQAPQRRGVVCSGCDTTRRAGRIPYMPAVGAPGLVQV